MYPSFLFTDSVATCIFHLNAYFFSFEMQSVHVQIMSKTYEEFIIRDLRVKRLRNIFLLTSVLLQAVYFLIIYKRFFLESPEDSFSNPLYIIFLICTALRLLMDIFIFHKTASYFTLIMRRRLDYFKSHHIPIPLQSKIILGWVSIMLLLIITEMLFICIVAIFLPGDYTPGSFINVLIDYHRYFNFPISDLLISSTITYVFYH